MILLIPLIPLLPLIQVIAGAPNEVIGALPQDDECHSDACGLNALQLRSKPLPPPTNETVNVNGTAVSVNGTKKKSRCYDLGIDPTCCQDFSISSWNYYTADAKYRACLNARLGCNPTPVATYTGSYQRKYYAFHCMAAIAAPPELMRLATGERSVTLIHCLEDRLCVWKPPSMTELNYNMVLIEANPFWSGRVPHAHGHLLFTQLDEGLHHIDQLQILRPNVIPHGVRCEGLLRVLSWVSFDLPAQLKRTLSALLQATGAGCQSLQDIEIECRDPPIESEQAFRIY